MTAGKSGKIPPGILKKYSNLTEDSTSNGNSEKYERNQYFFHPDHLGNTSFVTDASGEVSQHVEYLPFGEIMVDDRPVNDKNQYLYNGKELDEETGLYYYGARYYDPEVARWHGVDPMAEKYFALSPYNYVANNPLKFIDPDGMKVEYATDEDKARIKGAKKNDKEFRKAYRKLRRSKEIYVFKGTDRNSDKSDGNFKYDGEQDKFEINYKYGGSSRDSWGDANSSLRHETKHGIQYEHGEIGFEKVGKEWVLTNYDNIDELGATDFGVKNAKKGSFGDFWNAHSFEEKLEMTNNVYHRGNTQEVNSVSRSDGQYKMKEYKGKTGNVNGVLIERTDVGKPDQRIIPNTNQKTYDW